VFIPLLLIVFVLLIAIAGLIYTLKRKVQEHHHEPGSGKR